MNKRELMEKRAKAVAEMRAITEKPAGEAGDLSAEQQQQFDAMKAEVRSLDKAIERAEFLEQAERREQGTQISGTGEQHFDQEVRNFSMVTAMAAAAGMNVDNGRNREISQELERRHGMKAEGILVPLQVFEKRVMTTTAPGAGPGSNLIATDHYGNQFIDTLRAALIIRRLGARILNGLVGNVSIPGLKESATAAWVAENSGLSAGDMQFRSVTMSPKHCGALTEFSRNMLQQTSPDIEQLVRDDFAKVLARAVDKVALEGGDTNEPEGVTVISGTNSVDMSGGTTWAKVLEFIEALEIDDATGSAWATHPSVVKKLRSTPKEVDGSDVAISADYLMEGPGSLAGYPLASSTLVPKTASPNEGKLIFGNWSDLLIGYWSAFDLLVNPYETTAYTKGNVQVRGMLTMDVAVRHPESFAIGSVSLD